MIMMNGIKETRSIMSEISRKLENYGVRNEALQGWCFYSIIFKGEENLKRLHSIPAFKVFQRTFKTLETSSEVEVYYILTNPDWVEGLNPSDIAFKERIVTTRLEYFLVALETEQQQEEKRRVVA